MLTQQENERLTQVGAGTPMGELMRRYWHPVAAAAELDERPTKAVRLLGDGGRAAGRSRVRGRGWGCARSEDWRGVKA